MLVWLRLKKLAYKTGQTIYQIKHNLLSNYLIEQLKRLDIAMSMAESLQFQQYHHEITHPI